MCSDIKARKSRKCLLSDFQHCYKVSVASKENYIEEYKVDLKFEKKRDTNESDSLLYIQTSNLTFF